MQNVAPYCKSHVEDLPTRHQTQLEFQRLMTLLARHCDTSARVLTISVCLADKQNTVL